MEKQEQREWKIYNPLIIVVLIGILLVSMLVILQRTKQEGLTELYFIEHENLPKKAEEGERHGYAFAVRNLEGKSMRYKYETMISFYEGNVLVNEMVLGIRDFYLVDNETMVFDEEFTFMKEKAKVSVKLYWDSNEQEIYFWVERA